MPSRPFIELTNIVSAGMMVLGSPDYLVTDHLIVYFWMVATFPWPPIVLYHIIEVMGPNYVRPCLCLTRSSYSLFSELDLRCLYPDPTSSFSIFFLPLFHPNLVELYFTVSAPRFLYSHYFSIGLKQIIKLEPLLYQQVIQHNSSIPKHHTIPQRKWPVTTPPTAAQPGFPFTIPVVIAVNPIGTPAQNVQHLVVSASLRDEAGTGAAVGLSGNLTASVRSRTDNSMSGYAKLSPLTISQPGKFRLRVMLSAASYNGVVTKEYADSTVIHVHAGAAAQRPTPTQVARLQRLTTENLDISAADIAAWQRA
ncbi:hypothetical protein N7517_001970 [Penicillium concentricum]|uniref:Uncharacterized protein n=1 Tax=Penicillium concentricum TaxID=293559 RepID=A0A9W9SUJ3_9EURO|nr:uncharacterized protein N7517_001970 [Penicillium concentricum]KAJ5384059.1 hypothetical protein N7517_001970 [Penicillium concentricum]